VADYGFFAQAQTLPVEGMVHVSTLDDDYYYYEEATHSLMGRRTGTRYRLGDRIKAKVVRVDLQRRQMDFRVIQALGHRPKRPADDEPEERHFRKKKRRL
jgi:ribonuclease R